MQSWRGAAVGGAKVVQGGRHMGHLLEHCGTDISV